MNKLYFLLGVFFLTCCSSKKDILLLQDIENNANYSYSFTEHKIRVDDILKVEVSNKSFQVFNTTNLNEYSNRFQSTRESELLNGYKVNLDGFINLPDLGNLKVINLTISELENLIKKLVIDKELLLNPTVSVKLINAHFTILGEVNRPGEYFFDKNNIHVLEAIGIAGDLTINGQRKNIKIIRNNDNISNIYNVDLTSVKSLNNPNFQIFSGDIIIVNPNKSRVKNAGIIGNSGTLLSLLSFLLSSIIVINN